MKRLVLAGLFALLAGCKTIQPEDGMSIMTFQTKCQPAGWVVSPLIAVSDTQSVLVCAGKIDNPPEVDYWLFDRGGLVASASKFEIVSLAEDSQCLRLGAGAGSQAYVDCRLRLAEARTEEGRRRAHTRAVMVQAMIGNMQTTANNLSQMGQAYRPTPPLIQQPLNVNIKANCTAYKIGEQTYFQCY